jgi:hypothetical protein
MTLSVDRILGDRPFAEIGDPALAVSDDRRGLLGVAGTSGFGGRVPVGVYGTGDLACRALFRSRHPVHAMAFHPTLPLLAVGTGRYDGGYFFEGEPLLLSLETGTAVSVIEHRLGRQVLGLEWLDEESLRVLMAPPDDWQDRDAFAEGHVAVVRRTDWTAVPPASLTGHDLAGPRVPAPRPDGREAGRRAVTRLSTGWEPRRDVSAVERLRDGRILAALGGVLLESWLPSGEREWSVPDEEGGREIVVAGGEETVWVSLRRSEGRKRPQSVVRLSLRRGATGSRHPVRSRLARALRGRPAGARTLRGRSGARRVPRPVRQPPLRSVLQAVGRQTFPRTIMGRGRGVVRLRRRRRERRILPEAQSCCDQGCAGASGTRRTRGRDRSSEPAPTVYAARVRFRRR